MDAGGVKVPARAVVYGWRCCGGSAHTRNLPLAKIFFGSIARFTARMHAMSDDGEPQTSKCRLASVGQRNTIAELPAGSAARNDDAAFAYCIAEGGSTESGTIA